MYILIAERYNGEEPIVYFETDKLAVDSLYRRKKSKTKAIGVYRVSIGDREWKYKHLYGHEFENYWS